MTNYSPRSVLSFTPTTCGVVNFFTNDDSAVTHSDPLIGWAVVVASIGSVQTGGDELARVHDTEVVPMTIFDGQPWAVLSGLNYRVDPMAPWSSLAAETPVT